MEAAAMTQLMSTGQAARQLGVSVSLLRKLEAIGASPPAQRVAGLNRRFYTTNEVEVLREIITERRASQQPQRRERIAA
jgi:DNA-binding transcriptional MerR regulator